MYFQESIVKKITLLLCIGSISGCTIYPTAFGFKQGKFQNDYTVPIVNHVECEVRDSLALQAVRLIDEANEKPELQYPGAITLADKIREDQSIVNDFKPWLIDPRVYVQASLFLKSQIGLTFDLTADETNNFAIDPSLSASGGDHSLKLGISNHSIITGRKNQRTLSVLETTFDRFISKKCAYDPSLPKAEKKPDTDWIYPLRGRINLLKPLRTFVDYVLNDTSSKQRFTWAEKSLEDAVTSGFGRPKMKIDEFITIGKNIRSVCAADDSKWCNDIKDCYMSVLSRAGNEYVGKFNEVKSTDSLKFTDKLTFSTTIAGGLEPSIKFTPGSGSFKLETIAGGITGSRVDTHQLTVFLAADTYDKPKKKTKTIDIGGTTDAKLQISLPGTEVSAPAFETCNPPRAISNTVAGRDESFTESPEKREAELDALEKQEEKADDASLRAELIDRL